MKIVIDIDKRDFEFIKSIRCIMKNSDTFQRIAIDLFNAVHNGIMLSDDCLHANICENTTQGNCEWYTSDIRWTDKLSVTCNGDIIDFGGQVVGHINLENMKGGIK